VFKGDYLNVTGDLKWKKIASLVHNQSLVFSDFIQKVNRKNGKVSVTGIK